MKNMGLRLYIFQGGVKTGSSSVFLPEFEQHRKLLGHHSRFSDIHRQSLVKKPTSKNDSSNNTFHIFTIFNTLPTSTLAYLKIEQKSIVHLEII